MMYTNQKRREYFTKVVNYFDYSDDGDGNIANADWSIRYLRDRGLLVEAMVEGGKMHNRPKKLTENDMKNVKEVEYNGKTYWLYSELNCGSYIMYLLEPDLPVHNDRYFNWKKNKKYDSLECVLDKGVFSFKCIYRKDGSILIDVLYTKCENRHRNKVTIETIELNYGTNKDILDAINEWKERMEDDIETVM